MMIICLYLDDSEVSQQIAFISGPSLPQRSDHIFEILQDLVVAEIKWQHTHTHKLTTITLRLRSG